MPAGVKKFSASALLLLALSSLALGAAFDEEIKFYLNSGETHTTANITVEGAAYRVVKVGNVESFVFDPELRVLRDEAAIRKVIDAYVLTQYEQLPPINVSGIKENYEKLNASIGGTCMAGVDLFFLFQGPGSAYFFIYIQQSIKPKQWAATLSLNKSAVAVRAGLAGLKTSVESLDGAVASKNVEDVYTRLSSANLAAKNLQGNYSSLASSYKLIAEGDASEPGYIYAFGGSKHNCNVTANISNAFTSFLSLTNLPKPASLDKAGLFASISAATTARYEPAQVRKIYDGRVKLYEETRRTGDRIASGFASLGLTVAFVGQADGRLRAKLAAIANATAQAKAEEEAKAFDAERSSFNTQLSAYNTLLAEYNVTKAVLANISIHILNATAKYGTTDSRIQSLQAEQANLTARLALLEGDLKAGKSLEAQKLKDLGAEGRVLAAKAAELRPLEAQLDIVLIGGVLVAILVIAGVIWYARKRKREAEMGGPGLGG